MVDGPCKHYDQWKKSDTEGMYCLIPFILNIQKKQICRSKKLIRSYQGLQGGGLGNDCSWDWGIWGGKMDGGDGYANARGVLRTS